MSMYVEYATAPDIDDRSRERVVPDVRTSGVMEVDEPLDLSAYDVMIIRSPALYDWQNDYSRVYPNSLYVE